MGINSEMDDLRIKLHNLLKISCVDKESFESAKYLMESFVWETNNKIMRKIEEEAED